jgi:two-component sensor histidine kinase
MPTGGPNSERTLVLAPTGRDAEVAERLLREARFFTLACSDLSQLCLELSNGAGFAVITEEALAARSMVRLSAWVRAQPAWSDFPFVVVTGRGDAPKRMRDAQRLQNSLGNVTFLERPFHPSTLINIARAALRARQRQYEARAVLERQQLLAAELQHRTKNLLAVIQAIASGSLTDGEHGPDAFFSRLHALATAQNILVDADWRGALMREVVERCLESFSGRISIEGPPVYITPSVAQGFALVLHELATNAVKHGALSTSKGKVSIRWAVEQGTLGTDLVFVWQERDGPAAVPPDRKGFGSTLLEHAVANLECPPRLEYGPEGFSYELKASLAIAR